MVQAGSVDRGGVRSGEVEPVKHAIWRVPYHCEGDPFGGPLRGAHLNWFVVDALVGQELTGVFVQRLGEFGCEVAGEVCGLCAKGAVAEDPWRCAGGLPAEALKQKAPGGSVPGPTAAWGGGVASDL